jgi:Quinohemoprotein amine dehydrogenase, alpha subunit domain III
MSPSVLPGSITGVSPLFAYRDRTTTIALSASGTDFQNPTVDFGSGVIVEDVVVASPTGLVVTISVAGDAADGVRDITVTEGGEEYVYAGAFEVRAPATLIPLIGEFTQGGLAYAQIQLDDLTKRFTNYTVIQTPPGVNASWPTPTPFSSEPTLYFDVTAQGSYELLATTPGATETTTRVPFTVAANPAVSLQLGVSKSGTIARPYQTRLFAVSTTPGKLLVAKTTVVTGPAPQVHMLTDGSWQDYTKPTLSQETTLSQAVRYTTSDTYYFSVMDVSGESDYGFNLVVDELVTIENEVTNGNCLTPTDLGTLPVVVDNLVLATQFDTASIPDEEDWFSVTVGPEAVGQMFEVSTTSTEAGEADTTIEVLFGDCIGTYESLGASTDAEVDDSLTTTPILSAGTYLIKVARSTYSEQRDAADSGQLYSLSVSLLP